MLRESGFGDWGLGIGSPLCDFSINSRASLAASEKDIQNTWQICLDYIRITHTRAQPHYHTSHRTTQQRVCENICGLTSKGAAQFDVVFFCCYFCWYPWGCTSKTSPRRRITNQAYARAPHKSSIRHRTHNNRRTGVTAGVTVTVLSHTHWQQRYTLSGWHNWSPRQRHSKWRRVTSAVTTTPKSSANSREKPSQLARKTAI